MSDLSAAQVIAEDLHGSEVLVCIRDESAWGEGTMGADDFKSAGEDLVVAELILAALAAAGYAVVKLPQPDEDEWGDATWPVPLEGEKRPGYIRRDADGRFAMLSSPNPCATPADARALAGALLAAAQAAEAVS